MARRDVWEEEAEISMRMKEEEDKNNDMKVKK